MGEALGPDGTALSGAMRTVFGSCDHRQLDDIFPVLLNLYAEVSLTMAICSLEILDRAVLGSTSRTWGGGTRMDLLGVEGMTSVKCHLGYLSQTVRVDEWS